MVSSCTLWIRRYDVWVGFTPHNTSQRCKLRRPPNGASRKSCQAHTVSGLLARTAGCTYGRKLCAAFRTLTAAAVAFFQFLYACPLIINSELHHGSIAPAARVHVHEGHGATTLAGSGDRATQVFIKVIPTSCRKLPNRLAIWLAMAPLQSKVSVHATTHRLAALSEKPASCSTPHAQQVNSHISWRHLA